MALLLVFIAQTLVWGAQALPETPLPYTSTPSPVVADIEENTTTVVNTNNNLCGVKNDDNENRFFLHEKPLHWFDALITCWKEGQQLAVPRSPQEAKALGALLFTLKSLPGEVNNDALHVGIHILEYDSWRTLDGQLLSEAGYDLWLEGGVGECGAIFADGRYVRQPCGTRMRFACEETRSQAAPRQATEYIQVGDAGRFRLYEEPLPWALALQRCEAEGTTLAVPASARAAGLLAGVMVTRAARNAKLHDFGFFVGITDVVQDGHWLTVRGATPSSAGYEQWAPSQLPNTRRKNCGVLLNDGRYGQHSCMSPLAYCCQEIATPLDAEESVVVRGRYRLHTKPLPWFQALQACQRENATLMSVTNREITHVKELMRASDTRTTYNHYNEPLLNPIHVSIYDLPGNNTWERIYDEDGSKQSYYRNMNNDFENSYEESHEEGLNIRTENEGSSKCISFRYNGWYYTVSCTEPLPYVCKRK